MDLLICSDFQLAFVLRLVCGATVGSHPSLVKRVVPAVKQSQVRKYRTGGVVGDLKRS
jgi:hypothetical protein